VPVSLSAALLYEADQPVGSVGIFTDLREKMRMEQRLAQAQEQLLAQERQAIIAELAGAAAHELNQPLTSIMGYAQLIERQTDKTAETEPAHLRAVKIILAEAERMAGIVKKIGKITKYETTDYVGSARMLDLDRAAADSAEAIPLAEVLGEESKTGEFAAVAPGAEVVREAAPTLADLVELEDRVKS